MVQRRGMRCRSGLGKPYFNEAAPVMVQRPHSSLHILHDARDFNEAAPVMVQRRPSPHPLLLSLGYFNEAAPVMVQRPRLP